MSWNMSTKHQVLALLIYCCGPATRNPQPACSWLHGFMKLVFCSRRLATPKGRGSSRFMGPLNFYSYFAMFLLFSALFSNYIAAHYAGTFTVIMLLV